MYMKISQLILIFFVNVYSIFAQEQSSALYQNASFMIHDWNDMITNIIMDDGFSPAVISKHYAYANIAAYTAAQPGFSDRYQPLTGQLNLFSNPPIPKEGQKYDWRLTAIQAYKFIVYKVLYRSNYSDSMYKSHLEIIKKDYPDDKAIYCFWR